ncbi:glutathione S-transferase family protein [Aquabacter spiritensis]|uniref:Glutathione S-transferase n=1 Tax=Aquabacter spiritensis TaxID=933073 RepID=A0A4R3LSV7_9HYPH|nr:glutathione S-transferase [Aquabacter spiritensis]TCT03451.1 glutathione S-transferase [Aquabacter spiritensis]
MLTIWGRTNSVNVKKVLWAVHELEVPHERIDAGGAFGLVNDAEYRAMNPNGLVPLLKDGDLVLWESNAILRYLCAKFGAGSLWAEDPAERAIGDKWMDWATSNLAGPYRDVFWNLVRMTPETRDDAAVERGRTACSALLARVDQALADKPYLSGETFRMGDIPLACFAYGWYEMPIERPHLPNLDAWYARVRERPAFATAVAVPLT